MNTYIKPSQIPDSMLTLIREKFERAPQTMQMRIKADQLQRAGQYVQAMNVNKKIEEMFSATVASLIKESEKEMAEYELTASSMPDADVKDALRLIVVLFMSSDIIDSCLMDLHDIIHKTDKDFTFDKFADVSQLCRLMKEKMNYFRQSSSFLQYAHWGDIVDNMYEMMQNKAKLIIKKTDEAES